MENSAVKRPRVYDEPEQNWRHLQDVQAQVDSLEEKISIQQDGFCSGILDVEAHLTMVQDLLQLRDEEIAAERHAWRTKVQHLEHKVASQQRLIDAQKQDLDSQRQEFMTRIRYLEDELMHMQQSLQASDRRSEMEAAPPATPDDKHATSSAVITVERDIRLQDIESQQMVLQSLVAEQQRMIQALAAAKPAEPPAHAITEMLQEVKDHFAQELELHRQWALREKELALQEAEARHNTASALASAAQDSAWQYTLQMERSRADVEASQRIAAEEALDAMKDAYNKLAQSLASRMDQLTLHTTTSFATQQQQYTQQQHLYPVAVGSVASGSDVAAVNLPAHHHSQHPSSTSTSQPEAPAPSASPDKSSILAEQVGSCSADEDDDVDAAAGDSPATAEKRPLRPSSAAAGADCGPPGSSPASQGEEESLSSSSPFLDSYQTVTPRTGVRQVNLDAAAFSLIPYPPADQHTALSLEASTLAAGHHITALTARAAQLHASPATMMQHSPDGYPGSCEAINWNSPFDTDANQHTVCNNPLYDEGLLAMITPLRRVPQVSPIAMSTLSSVASVSYRSTQPAAEPAAELSISNSLDFPSGPPRLPDASSHAVACGEASSRGSVVQLSLDLGLAAAERSSEVSRYPPAGPHSFSFPSCGSAAEAALCRQAAAGPSRLAASAASPARHGMPRASLLEEFSFDSGEENEDEPEECFLQLPAAMAGAAVTAAPLQQQQAAPSSPGKQHVQQHSPTSARGVAVMQPCSPRSPTGKAAAPASPGSRAPATLQKLRKQRAPLSSLISRFEQQARGDSPESDEGYPLHNKTNVC